MRPVLFELGSFPVHSFGVTMTAAFVVAGFLMGRDFARKGEPPDLAWSIVAYGLVGGLLGSQLTLALHEWEVFAAAPLAYVMGFQGMIWYGGLAGGVLATLWPIRRAGVPWAGAADTAAPALALGHAIGRLGCHLAGDGDWGTPSELPWAVAYTGGVSPWPHPPGVRVHPAPLYEALALVLVFALLWSLRCRLGPRGTLFALYLTLAGTTRFLVETVRVNEAVFLGLTEAQWISLALVAAGGAWLAWRLRPGLLRRTGRPGSRATPPPGGQARVSPHTGSGASAGRRRGRQGRIRAHGLRHDVEMMSRPLRARQVAADAVI